MDGVEEAKQAINKIFSDDSVSVGTTRDRLETLREEINDLLETLPSE